MKRALIGLLLTLVVQLSMPSLAQAMHMADAELETLIEMAGDASPASRGVDSSVFQTVLLP